MWARVCNIVLTNDTIGILKFWITITLMVLLSRRNPIFTLTNIVWYDNYAVSFLEFTSLYLLGAYRYLSVTVFRLFPCFPQLGFGVLGNVR